MTYVEHQGGGRLAGAIVACVGLGFTLIMALGLGEGLCVTAGCSLHHETGFLGLSFWWWGAAAFAVVGGLAAAGRTRDAFRLALALVALDVLFMLWMALTATCFSCMLAGGLLALLLPAIRPMSVKGRRVMLLLLMVWGLAFTPNLFASIREMVGPWPVIKAQDTRVEVYFSPSCEVCQLVLFDVLRDGWAGHATFYPVAKNETDVAKIRTLREDLAHNATLGEAFESMLDESPRLSAPGLFTGLGLRLGLARNKLALYRHGVESVPLILIQGRAPRPGEAKN